MTKLLLIITLTFSATAFALNNCVEFPGTSTSRSVDENITEVSSEMSYGNCANSVLYKKEFVAKLVRLIKHDGEQKCVYKYDSLAFMCRK